MSRRLALIHTVTSLVPIFQELCSELLPSFLLFNIVDESLLKNTIHEGRMSKRTARRLLSYLISAQEGEADAAMVTCSSVGGVVDHARPFVEIPLFRVDQPMADKAVGIGGRVAVAATLQTTLDPTVSLIKARAAVAGREIEVVSRLCEGAFEAVIAGDTAKHDELVGNGLADLGSKADVIVLAQASMARVAGQLPESPALPPILSSPRLAVEHLASVL